MKKAICPAIVFATLILSACGGGGSGTSGSGNGGNQATNNDQAQAPTNVAPKLVSVSQRIQYYGDSTVYGYATETTRVAIPAPTAFADALPRNPSHTVENLGFSGQTACELLNGVNQAADWATRMDESNATVVILNHGINDAVSPTKSVPVSQYRTCLSSLARIAKAEGKRVIFETPNPIVEQGTPRLPTYVQAMREVAAAENLSVIDQYAELNRRYNNNAEAITRDSLHPTDQVYIQKGEYAASVFSNLNL